MKYPWLFMAFLSASAVVSSCATKDPEPIRSYSVTDFTADPSERLYAKNGNLICGSQKLALSSTQLVTREVNGIPESIDLELSRFNCEKPESRDESCRVDVYSRMSFLTDMVNKELKKVVKERQELREKFHQDFGDNAKPTIAFLGSLDDDKRQNSYKILDRDKDLKRQAQQQRRAYENRIDGLEEMVYGCNY